MRWPKYWSFSLNISPSNEHPGLMISFRMDWLDLLAVQGTLKSSKASILMLSFLHSPLSHPYMTTGKTIALTRRTFVGKVMSSASVRSVAFLSFIEPIFAWNVPLVSLIFLKRSLVFPILLFSSISLHWLLRKASVVKWVKKKSTPLKHEGSSPH